MTDVGPRINLDDQSAFWRNRAWMGEVDTWHPKPPSAGPSFGETLQAAALTENTLGSLFLGRTIDPALRGQPIAIDEELEALRQSPLYGPQLAYAPAFNNRYDIERWKARIEDEAKQNAIIEESGGLGIVLSTALGILDPINLVPIGGGLYRAGKAAGMAGRILAGGAGGALGATLNETVLNQEQLTREVEGSVAVVGASTVLGGILGAAAGGLSARARARATRDLDQYMSTPVTPGTGSVNAKMTLEPNPSDANVYASAEDAGRQFAGARSTQAIQKAISRLSGPLGRTIVSTNDFVVDMARRVATLPMALTGEAPISVEAGIKDAEGFFSATRWAVGDAYRGWMSDQGYKTAVGRAAGALRGGMVDQFNAAVSFAYETTARAADGRVVLDADQLAGKVLDVHGKQFEISREMVPHLQRAADNVQKVADYVSQRAIEVGALEPGQRLLGAENWLVRLWDFDKFNNPAYQRQFIDLVIRKGAELRAQAEPKLREANDLLLQGTGLVTNSVAPARKVIGAFDPETLALGTSVESRRIAGMQRLLGSDLYAGVRAKSEELLRTGGVDAVIDQLPPALREHALQQLPADQPLTRLARTLRALNDDVVQAALTPEQRENVALWTARKWRGQGMIGADDELVAGQWAKMHDVRATLREAESYAEALPRGQAARTLYDEIVRDPVRTPFEEAMAVREELSDAIRRARGETTDLRERISGLRDTMRTVDAEARTAMREALRRKGSESTPSLKQYDALLRDEGVLLKEQIDDLKTLREALPDDQDAIIGQLQERAGRLDELRGRIEKETKAVEAKVAKVREEGAVAGERAVHVERLQAAAAKAVETRAALREATDRLKTVTEVLRHGTEFKKVTDKRIDDGLRRIKEAKRLERLYGTYGAMDDAGLRDHALELMDTIRGSKGTRSYFTDPLSGKAKSLHEREVPFTVEELFPFTRNDVTEKLDFTMRTLIPDLETKAVFGDFHAEGALRTARDRWNEMIDQARIRGESDKRIRKMEKQRDADVRDLRAMVERLHGVYDMPDNPESFVHAAPRMLKKLSIPVYLGNISLSNLPDLAKVIFRYGGGEPFRALVAMMRHPAATMRAARSEMAVAQAAAEYTLQTHINSITQVMHHSGSGLDKGLDALVTSWSHLSGITYLMRGLKTVAGLSAQAKAVRLIGRVGPDAEGWARLTRRERDWMLANSMGPDMAARMAREIGVPGRLVEQNGLLFPQTADWADAHAARVFRMAIRREMDLVASTPGQEVPLLMSREYINLFTMFKTFNASSLTRTLGAGLQQGDASVVMGMMSMLGLSAFSLYLRGLVIGGDWWNRMSDAEMAYRIIDYSGLVPYVMDLSTTIERASGGVFGIMPAFSDAPPRFAPGAQSVIGSVSPALGLAENIVRGISLTYAGHPSGPEHLGKTIPLATLPWFRWLTDQVVDWSKAQLQ